MEGEREVQRDYNTITQRGLLKSAGSLKVKGILNLFTDRQMLDLDFRQLQKKDSQNYGLRERIWNNKET